MLDVAPLAGGALAALDSHGRLLRLAGDLVAEEAPPVRCPDRCILYSGLLLPPERPEDQLLAFCGTVFCQVRRGRGLSTEIGGGGRLERDTRGKK